MDDFNTPDSDGTVDLRVYATMLWRRRWTILLTVVAVVAAALGLSYAQEPTYTAQAELAIEPLRRSQDTELTDLILGSSAVATERRVITSAPVTQAVIDLLALPTSPEDLRSQVTVDGVRDTRVVTVTAADADPARAAAIANAYVGEYLRLRRAEALDRVEVARQTLATRAAALRDELDAVNRQIAEALADEEEAEVQALEAQREALLTQLAQTTAQEVATDAEADLVRGGGTILRDAVAPDAPSAPRPRRTAVLALLLGGLLGVAVAFAREFLDDGVRSEDVLVRVTDGAPVFGRIPVWAEQHNRAVALVDPHDHAVEAYRELRANVRFLMGRSKRETEWQSRRRSRGGSGPRGAGVVGKSVLITSSIAGEGKSSTAANLAVVAAQGGARVVLIDADMRRPQIDNIFGVGTTAGLSDHLAEGGDLSRRLLTVGSPNLQLLPSGAPPPNPSELLASRAMADVLLELEATHDLVVIDSPPVLAVADALELAQLASATLLVASSTSSSQRAIRRAVERLGQIGVVVSGSVLNRLDQESTDSYYGYYRPYAPSGASTPTPPPANAVPNGPLPVDSPDSLWPAETPKR